MENLKNTLEENRGETVSIIQQNATSKKIKYFKIGCASE